MFDLRKKDSTRDNMAKRIESVDVGEMSTDNNVKQEIPELASAPLTSLPKVSPSQYADEFVSSANLFANTYRTEFTCVNKVVTLEKEFETITAKFRNAIDKANEELAEARQKRSQALKAHLQLMQGEVGVNKLSVVRQGA